MSFRLADEQLGMFSLTNFKLDNLMAKVKTITCVKGKSSKKVSGYRVLHLSALQATKRSNFYSLTGLRADQPLPFTYD